MGIFDKRIAFKPYEYPEVLKFREAIRLSRWDVEEYDFDDDVQDFKKRLSEEEKNVIKNTMLAISQIEAANVKTFWANVGNVLQKPEIGMTGLTMGENEVTHSLAYSHLLEVLGLNEDFQDLLKSPVIEGRVNYLNKYLTKKVESDEKFYTLSLMLFTLFVERVSLFSQFAVIKSFRRHKNLLKSIDNVVLSTQKDELLHSQLGIYLLNIIREENPEWFNEEFNERIYDACKKAYKAELGIVEWIFEKGDLEFLTKDEIVEFTKDNFNTSLESMGLKPLFEVNQDLLKNLEWFNVEIYAYTRNDFFNTKSANYNKISVKPKNIKNSLRNAKTKMVQQDIQNIHEQGISEERARYIR